jgi:NAD(P)H-nitrite reductase large subunit
MVDLQRVIVIGEDRYPPYARNLVASVLAGKISLDENAINAKEVTLASRAAGVVKRRFMPNVC